MSFCFGAVLVYFSDCVSNRSTLVLVLSCLACTGCFVFRHVSLFCFCCRLGFWRMIFFVLLRCLNLLLVPSFRLYRLSDFFVADCLSVFFLLCRNDICWVTVKHDGWHIFSLVFRRGVVFSLSL